MSGKIGLVLTGGGARAAYQAGVLRGIAESLGGASRESPFTILVGVSAGAINSALLAARLGNFDQAVEALCRLWNGLRTEQVIRSDWLGLGSLAVRWLRDLSLGGLLGNDSRATHLLDARPLRAFLSEHIDFAAIRKNLAAGILESLAVSATNYSTGTTITFYETRSAVEPWIRSTRLGQPAELTLDHVLASAAIPVFFQPVRLNHSYYGDGCIRLIAPLSPAVHLGAERIIAVGVRYQRPAEMTLALNRQPGDLTEVSLVDIAGVMLNAAFLDALEGDIERMQRINQTVALLSPEARQRHPAGLRMIPLLAIGPSRDLGTLASEQFERFSPMLKYLLRGIGASAAKGWDLLSYLAFDEAYTGQLIELGYRDVLARRGDIERFFMNN